MTIDDDKFTKIYRFVLLVTLAVFAYVFCISFLPIPQDAKDNVKTILIFLLGYLSANGNYLTGGNPTPKKPDTVTPVTNADSVTVNNAAGS